MKITKVITKEFPIPNESIQQPLVCSDGDIQRMGRMNRWITPRSDVATAVYNQIKKEESNEQKN